MVRIIKTIDLAMEMLSLYLQCYNLEPCTQFVTFHILF